VAERPRPSPHPPGRRAARGRRPRPHPRPHTADVPATVEAEATRRTGDLVAVRIRIGIGRLAANSGGSSPTTSSTSTRLTTSRVEHAHRPPEYRRIVTNDPLPEPSDEDVDRFVEDVIRYAHEVGHRDIYFGDIFTMSEAAGEVHAVSVVTGTVTAIATAPDATMHTVDGSVPDIHDYVKPDDVARAAAWAWAKLKLLGADARQGIVGSAALAAVLTQVDNVKDLAAAAMTWTGAEIMDLARIIVEIRSRLP
jgi:hypothetical protein